MRRVLNPSLMTSRRPATFGSHNKGRPNGGEAKGYNPSNFIVNGLATEHRQTACHRGSQNIFVSELNRLSKKKLPVVPFWKGTSFEKLDKVRFKPDDGKFRSSYMETLKHNLKTHHREVMKDYKAAVELDPELPEPKIYMMPNTPSFEYLQRCVNAVHGRQSVLFSFDVEAWELNTKIITEVGVCIYDPRENGSSLVPVIRGVHLIPLESLQFRNSRFVDDTKGKYYGRSVVMPLAEIKKTLQSLMEYYLTPKDDGYIRAIVGHNVKGDVHWLSTLGVQFPSELCYDGKKSDQIQVFDTEKLYTCSYGQNGAGLARILKLLEIPNSNMHNAGNDAYYTLQLLLSWCDPSFRVDRGMDNLRGMAQKVEKMAPEWKLNHKKGVAHIDRNHIGVADYYPTSKQFFEEVF